MKIYGKRLRLTPQEEDIIRQFRGKTLDNINDNTALDLHLKERGIEKKDVVSVKHWQSANGDYRFSVVTKENLGVNETTIIKNVSKFIQEYSPEYPKIARKREGSHLLVVNPADIHIGKYANSDETGEEYNSNIAFVRVIEGIEGLIQKSNGFAIGKILFCIGNDVLHIDNVYNTTTKGTRQDVDGKWWEHLDIAMSLYVKCIERLREIAPVDVVHCMSNHDYQSGYHLAKKLRKLV